MNIRELLPAIYRSHYSITPHEAQIMASKQMKSRYLEALIQKMEL